MQLCEIWGKCAGKHAWISWEWSCIAVVVSEGGRRGRCLGPMGAIVGSPRCLVCVYGLAVLLESLKAGCVNLESDV
jgi:hypothetical protein